MVFSQTEVLKPDKARGTTLRSSTVFPDQIRRRGAVPASLEMRRRNPEGPWRSQECSRFICSLPPRARHNMPRSAACVGIMMATAALILRNNRSKGFSCSHSEHRVYPKVVEAHGHIRRGVIRELLEVDGSCASVSNNGIGRSRSPFRRQPLPCMSLEL